MHGRKAFRRMSITPSYVNMSPIDVAGDRHPARHRTSTADKTVEEPFDLAEHASPLPKRRQDILDGLPGIPVALPAGTEQIYFTKTMLSQILGGSMQGLVVR